MPKRSMSRTLLAGLGCISTALGIVGIFVPLLPTTPFLLLAAACFIRSSDRLYQWLISNRWLGAYIRNYREHRAITLRAKVVTLGLLWLTIGYSTWAVARGVLLRVLLVAIAVGVTVHVLRLKTLTREMLARAEEERAGENGQ